MRTDIEQSRPDVERLCMAGGAERVHDIRKHFVSDGIQYNTHSLHQVSHGQPYSFLHFYS